MSIEIFSPSESTLVLVVSETATVKKFQEFLRGSSMATEFAARCCN
jgi:hypothetical protein